MVLKRKYSSCRSDVVPVWLISADSRFRTDTEECLRKIGSFSFQGAYAKWQSAIHEFKNANAKSRQIALVDEDPKTQNGAGCLSFLKNAAPALSIIVLMNDTSDENLMSALSHGVSGFLVKPTSIDEIVAALNTVIHGEVAMKRSVLERIACLIPGSTSMKELLLTNREQEVVNLVIDGLSTKEIADKLSISYYTVDTHFKNIYQKLKVNNRSSLVSLVLHHKVL